MFKLLKKMKPIDWLYAAICVAFIVVQGGTFYNHAVLRALEKIADVRVTCPDISGIMGAFGAALIAKRTYHGQRTSMLSLEEIVSLAYKTNTTRCKGCTNGCTLTINLFSDGRRHITGNRCEKGTGSDLIAQKGENLVAYKRKRIFAGEKLFQDKKSTR